MSKFKMFKLGSVAGVALAAAIAGASGTAQAVPCSGVTTLDAWATAGSCDVGDKTFTWLSDSVGINPLVSFDQFGLEYTFTINFGSDGLTVDSNLHYTVTVNNPSASIVAVSVDSTVVPTTGGTKVTKNLSDDLAPLGTIESLNGSVETIIGLNTKFLDVNEDFDIGTGKLTSATNTITQAVPEPATLGILGMGLIGLGLLRRRTAKA